MKMKKNCKAMHPTSNPLVGDEFYIYIDAYNYFIKSILRSDIRIDFLSENNNSISSEIDVYATLECDNPSKRVIEIVRKAAENAVMYCGRIKARASGCDSFVIPAYITLLPEDFHRLHGKLTASRKNEGWRCSILSVFGWNYRVYQKVKQIKKYELAR